MSPRAALCAERAALQAKLAKEIPKHDAALASATAQRRQAEAAVEAAKRGEAEAITAKQEATAPTEARLRAIEAELSRSLPACVAELRTWLDHRYVFLQQQTPSLEWGLTRPRGPGSPAQQRISATSMPSLMRAIEAVLAAQREACDALLLEADVEARCAAIRAEVEAAERAIRIEPVEGPTILDRILDLLPVG